MKTKDIQADLIEKMEMWQKIEDASVVSTGKIIEKTKNPFIRQVMEIIQADSRTHHRVQELIARLTREGVVFSTDDLAEVWDGIEDHIRIEKQMVEYVSEALAAIKGRKMLIQEYLLEYLKVDEQKHDDLLEALEKIKAGAYPYA